jgi:hypothetical protein
MFGPIMSDGRVTKCELGRPIHGVVAGLPAKAMIAIMLHDQHTCLL